MSINPGELVRRKLDDTGFEGTSVGDLDSILTGASTIAANKVRTLGGGLKIADGGGKLTIADTGKLVLL